MGASRFVKAHTTPTPKPFSDLQADGRTPNTIPGWAARTTCHSKRSTRQSSIFQKKCSGFGVRHLKIHPGSGAADISGNKSPLSVTFSPSCRNSCQSCTTSLTQMWSHVHRSHPRPQHHHPGICPQETLPSVTAVPNHAVSYNTRHWRARAPRSLV